MADDLLGLAELTTINDAALADINVTDLLDDAPILAAMPAQPASNGTVHKYLKETGAPVVGFRAINDGRDLDHSEDTAVTVTLKLLDASFRIDVGWANAYKGGRDAAVARALKRHLKAAYFMAEKQFIYGTGNDSDGFAGLADNAGYNNNTDTMVVDATGSTASTGSSVWFFRFAGEDAVSAVGGNDGNIVVEETTIIQAVGSSAGTYPALYTGVTGWLGLQLGSAYDVGRICNLTADSGKGLTDDLIAAMLVKFPASRMPSVMAMSRRSLGQLQQSRTATNSTGAPAPFPTEAFGIPIIVTDAIVDTETLLT